MATFINCKIDKAQIVGTVKGWSSVTQHNSTGAG